MTVCTCDHGHHTAMTSHHRSVMQGSSDFPVDSSRAERAECYSNIVQSACNGHRIHGVGREHKTFHTPQMLDTRAPVALTTGRTCTCTEPKPEYARTRIELAAGRNDPGRPRAASVIDSKLTNTPWEKWSRGTNHGDWGFLNCTAPIAQPSLLTLHPSHECTP